MSRIGLRFLPNPSGDGEGLGDAGIETFRDRPFAAVARETGQNSRDARDNSEAPVRVAYDVMSVKAVDFPSIGEFRSAAQICLDKAVARCPSSEHLAQIAA